MKLDAAAQPNATPSDVDKLLHRIAAQDCTRLVAGISDCSDELAFTDWCATCQARGLLQKYTKTFDLDAVAVARRSAPAVVEDERVREIRRKLAKLKAAQRSRVRRIERDLERSSQAACDVDDLIDITDVLLSLLPVQPAASTEDCPHLHQPYPGTPANKCLDCGEIIATASTEAQDCELCDDPLPPDSQYAIHESCADKLRRAMKEPIVRTLTDDPVD